MIQSEEKHSTGKVRRLNGSFTFRVQGYSGLSSAVGVSTESPEFDLCGHIWQLRIFAGGSLDAHRGYLSYYLASKSSRQARASYTLMVCDQSDPPDPTKDETFSSSGVRTFEAKGVQVDGWGRDKFMSSSALLSTDAHFCVNDTVIFKVEISVYGDLELCGFPVVCNGGSGPYASLANSMHSLLMDDEGNVDIELICGHAQETLTAHRCILRARSPVFHAMLNIGSFAYNHVTPHQKSPEFVTSYGQETKIADQIVRNNQSTERVASTDPETLRLQEWWHPDRDEADFYQSDTWQAKPSRYQNYDSTFGDDSDLKGNTSYPNAAKKRRYVAKCCTSDIQQKAPKEMHASTPFEEARYGRVLIPDVEPNVMRELLLFMYTDACSSISILETMAIDLFIASSKYQISPLFNFVEDYLCLQITVESCLGLLELADTYDAEKLRSKCLSIATDNAPEVLNSEVFKSMDEKLKHILEHSIDQSHLRSVSCCTSTRGMVTSVSSAGTPSSGAAGEGDEADLGLTRSNRCIMM